MDGRVIIGTVAVGLALIAGSFTFGRITEQQARRSLAADRRKDHVVTTKQQNHLSPVEEKGSDNALIANVACVSFSELWNIMRAAKPEQRERWAQQLQQLPWGTQQNAAIDAFYKAWIALDPPATIRSLESFASKELQCKAVVAASGAAPAAALPGIAALLYQVQAAQGYVGTTNVLDRWSQIDPEAAGNFLLLHPDFGWADFFHVATNWAKVDPEKTQQWFANLRLPPLQDKRMPDTRRSEAAKGLLAAWVEREPPAAVAFAISHSEDPDFNCALAALTLRFCGKSQNEAKAFIDQLPTEKAQEAALEGIFELMDGRDPELLHEGDREENTPNIELESVPPWVVALPQNVWIGRASDLFEYWNRADTVRAEAWLRTLPPAVRSKTLVRFFAGSLPDVIPRVFELLELVEPSLRDLALKKFMERWRDDPEQGRADIQAAPLSGKQKQILLQRLETKS